MRWWMPLGRIWGMYAPSGFSRPWRDSTETAVASCRVPVAGQQQQRQQQELSGFLIPSTQVLGYYRSVPPGLTATATALAGGTHPTLSLRGQQLRRLTVGQEPISCVLCEGSFPPRSFGPLGAVVSTARASGALRMAANSNSHDNLDFTSGASTATARTTAGAAVPYTATATATPTGRAESRTPNEDRPECGTANNGHGIRGRSTRCGPPVAWVPVLLVLLLCISPQFLGLSPDAAVAQTPPATTVSPATTQAEQAVEAPWLMEAARARPTAADSRRDCVICHLTWAESFDRRGAVLLMDRPPGPVVAESETCLGCHDGSVGDDRRRVWTEHGHRTRIKPPPTMQVPPVLPLTDGQITCRTCHTAHGGTGPETIATIVFLRVRNESSQLCVLCHQGMAKGPTMGTHPLGGMPWPVPEEVILAGGKVGPRESQLICQTCHVAHGSAQDDLLVMGTESSQLCLTCHAKMRPGMFRPDIPREHPQNPPLETPAQFEAIAEMGTKTGPGDTLICLSCHKVHDGLAGRYMLAGSLHDSDLCIRCHPEREAMVGTPHDLRKSAPESVNRLGQTPEQSGPCGACHSFHTFARRPDPMAGDPTGLCTSCHQPGAPAAKNTGLPISHPVDVTAENIVGQTDLQLYPPFGEAQPLRLACLTCHDPHMVRQGEFLREEKPALCGECHADQATNMVDAHNFTDKPDLKNARGQSAKEAGHCGFCHAVHQALGPMMWVATQKAPDSPNELCTECHRAEGMGAAKPVSLFTHPTGPKAVDPTLTTSLPLYNASVEILDKGFVACGSCHDPHVGLAKSPDMLRNGLQPAALCVECHTEQAQVHGGPHDISTTPAAWPDDLQEPGRLCLGCHKAHSNDAARQLWTVAPAVGAPTHSDAICIACHVSAKWSIDGPPQKDQAMHPRLIERPLDAGDLPIAPAEAPGGVAAVECRTCHNAHLDSAANHLLRRTHYAETQGVCFVCHDNARPIGRSLHAYWVAESLRSADRPCGPCHAVHAVDGSLRENLWAAGLNPAGADRTQQECLACHGQGGSAKAVNVVQHPDVIMQELLKRHLAIPAPVHALIPEDRITCTTCHLPHGRQDIRGPVPPASATQAAVAQLRALKPMLRSRVSDQLCAMCHGFDGARRYLYWHRPEQRPVELTSPTTAE